MQDNARDVRALSQTEIERFTEATTEYYESVDRPVYRNGFGYLFVMYMGLRCGEALGLQYKHIELEKRIVTVEQSVVTVKTETEEDKANELMDSI